MTRNSGSGWVTPVVVLRPLSPGRENTRAVGSGLGKLTTRLTTYSIADSVPVLKLVCSSKSIQTRAHTSVRCIATDRLAPFSSKDRTIRTLFHPGLFRPFLIGLVRLVSIKVANDYHAIPSMAGNIGSQLGKLDESSQRKSCTWTKRGRESRVPLSACNFIGSGFPQKGTTSASSQLRKKLHIVLPDLPYESSNPFGHARRRKL